MVLVALAMVWVALAIFWVMHKSWTSTNLGNDAIISLHPVWSAHFDWAAGFKQISLESGCKCNICVDMLCLSVWLGQEVWCWVPVLCLLSGVVAPWKWLPLLLLCECCPDSTWSATGLLWAGLGVCAVTSGSCSPSGKSAHPPVASSTLLGASMTVDKCMLLYA